MRSAVLQRPAPLLSFKKSGSCYYHNYNSITFLMNTMTINIIAINISTVITTTVCITIITIKIAKPHSREQVGRLLSLRVCAAPSPERLAEASGGPVMFEHKAEVRGWLPEGSGKNPEAALLTTVGCTLLSPKLVC